MWGGIEFSRSTIFRSYVSIYSKRSKSGAGGSPMFKGMECIGQNVRSAIHIGIGQPGAAVI